MKMPAIIKGIGALVVIGATWLTSNLSPLIWVLLGLVVLDLLLHLHKGLQQQFTKLWAAIAAMGLPTYLATNSAKVMAFSPDVLKVVVAALVLSYLRIVMPDVLALISRIKWSSNKAQNTVDVAALQALVKDLQAQVDAKAEPTINQAGIGSQGVQA